MASSYNHDVVERALEKLEIELEELFLRARANQTPAVEPVGTAAMASIDYKQFLTDREYPEYVIQYCENIVCFGTSAQHGGVRSLAARRHNIPDLNARRSKKR